MALPVAVAIPSTATAATGTVSVAVPTGQGANFPAVPFRCLVGPAVRGFPMVELRSGRAQVAMCTTVSGDTLSLVLGTNGTAGKSIQSGDIIDATPFQIDQVITIPSQGPGVSKLLQWWQHTYTPAVGDTGGLYGLYHDLNIRPSGNVGSIQVFGHAIFLNQQTAGDMLGQRGVAVTHFKNAAGTETDSRLIQAALLDTAGSHTQMAAFDAALGMNSGGGTATSTEFVAYRARQVTSTWATNSWAFQTLGGPNWISRLGGKVVIGDTTDAVTPGAASAELDVRGHVRSSYEKVLGTNQTFASTTSLANITGFVVPILASTNYAFRFVFEFDGDAANDIKIGMIGPTSCNGFFYLQAWDESGVEIVAPVRSTFTGTAGSVVIACGGAATVRRAVLEGVVLNGANAGNLAPQAAQNSSGVTASTIFNTSTMRVRHAA